MQPRDTGFIEAGIAPADGTSAANRREQRDFGTSSLYAQLSDKQGSSVITAYTVWTKNTTKLAPPHRSRCNEGRERAASIHSRRLKRSVLQVSAPIPIARLYRLRP